MRIIVTLFLFIPLLITACDIKTEDSKPAEKKISYEILETREFGTANNIGKAIKIKVDTILTDSDAEDIANKVIESEKQGYKDLILWFYFADTELDEGADMIFKWNVLKGLEKG